jgi:hypothetical protein
VEECTYFWGVNTSWGINTAKSKDLCIRKIIRLHNQQFLCINIKMYRKSWPSMASLLIISSSSIYTSNIVVSAKETHHEAIFQSSYEKLLTIHASILYLNKIKRLALAFTTEAHAIHPSIILLNSIINFHLNRE